MNIMQYPMFYYAMSYYLISAPLRVASGITIQSHIYIYIYCVCVYIYIYIYTLFDIISYEYNAIYYIMLYHII